MMHHTKDKKRAERAQAREKAKELLQNLKTEKSEQVNKENQQ